MNPLRPLLAALALSTALVACGGDDCETCGGEGGAPTTASASASGTTCKSTMGELHGKVSTSDMPSPGAILDLRQMPGDVPTHVMADDSADYTVQLEAGSWIVGGESADGYCNVSQPETVTIEACGSLEHDVLLDACVL